MKTNVEELFSLARPYLERNDFGAAHTRRVFNIAQENFSIPPELRDLTYSSVILHDIGGGSIKDQYEMGPKIAASILKQLGRAENFIEEVCDIIRTHHDHPDNPSLAFRVLYDSDKLVMFSPEEFPHYNSTVNFDWNNVVNLIYSEHMRQLAKKMLRQRLNEVC